MHLHLEPLPFASRYSWSVGADKKKRLNSLYAKEMRRIASTAADSVCCSKEKSAVGNVRTIVTGRTRTAGCVFWRPNLRHVLHVFRCTLAARAHLRCTRRRSIVEGRKLTPGAGQLRFLSGGLALPVTTQCFWKWLAHSSSL